MSRITYAFHSESLNICTCEARVSTNGLEEGLL